MLCELTGEPFPETPVVSSTSLILTGENTPVVSSTSLVLTRENTQASVDTDKKPDVREF